MKCYRCGAELDAGVKFCVMCGSPQGFTQDLITAAAQGNQDAITELYNRTYNNVYQSVRMLVKDEDMALDIVQDTYIRGFQYLSQLDDPHSFRAWIKRIGINTAKNYLKKKQPILFSEMEGSEEDDSPELQFVDERQENLPEVAMDRQETTRLINEILDELSDDQRMVITMYYYEEMNAREIADELGISENTIRSRLNYGKKKIEAKVLELEKRDGIRLHSLAPIPFLLMLFRAQKVSAAVRPDGAILQGVQRMVGNSMGYGTVNPQGMQTGVYGTQAPHGNPAGTYKKTASAGGRRAAAGGVKTAAGTATKAAAGTAAKGIGAKVLAGVVAAAVVAGGGGAAYAVYSHNASKARNNAAHAGSVMEEKQKNGLQANQGSMEDGTNGEEEKKILTPQEGLEAFGATKSTATGNEYTGYYVSVEGVSGYDGSTYYSPGADSEIPTGWLDYQIADMDHDGTPELVAVTACDTPVKTSQETISTIGVEVYEWDEEGQSARLASSIRTRDIYQEAFGEMNEQGMMVGQYFGSLNGFIFGEDSKYIGLAREHEGKYIYDGVMFEMVALTYQNEELKTAAQPVYEGGSAFEPEWEEQTEKNLQGLQELGISITAESIPNAATTVAQMDQLVKNYQQIVKIQTEDIVGNYEAVSPWAQKAYGGEQPEPLAVTNIRCEGSHPASEQTPVAETPEAGQETEKVKDDSSLTAVLEAYNKALAGKDYFSYSFIYLDNDEIPELVAEGKDTSTGTDIYYYASDHTVKSINMGCGQFCFSEKSGLLDNHWTRQGTDGHVIYQLQDGEIEKLGGGEGRFPQYIGTDYSAEEFKANAEYYWENQKTDRKIFEKNMASMFPYTEAECTRYNFGTCIYISLKEACREQLGIL